MLLPFFSFLHVQVNKATLYASHFVLRSGLECIFAAHRWVIAMDSQMIAKLEMPSITYVHTAQKETIPVHAALEKAFRPEMMKNSFKNYNMWSTRKYVQNTQLCTEYIVLHDFMTATLTCCLVCSQKYNLAWGLQQLREV